MGSTERKNQWLWISLVLIGITGLCFALLLPSQRVGAWREIGGALVSGAVVGGVLLIYQERAERDRELQATAREQRHVAAADELEQIAVAIKFHLELDSSTQASFVHAEDVATSIDDEWEFVAGHVQEAMHWLGDGARQAMAHYTTLRLLASDITETEEICSEAVDSLRHFIFIPSRESPAVQRASETADSMAIGFLGTPDVPARLVTLIGVSDRVLASLIRRRKDLRSANDEESIGGY